MIKKKLMVLASIMLFFVCFSMVLSILPAQIERNDPVDNAMMLEMQKDTSNVDYFEINPYSIDSDTNLSNVNNTKVIKMIEKLDCSGIMDTVMVEVFFPQGDLPSISDTLFFDFRCTPLTVSQNAPSLQAIFIDIMKYDSSWQYSNVFNSTTEERYFLAQETSTEITFTDFDKSYYNHENYIKFRFNFTVEFASSQADFDIYFNFAYLKLHGGNNLDIAKILPNKTSFGGGANQTIRINNETQYLQPDGLGNYDLNSTCQALLETEDQDVMEFHVEPLEGLNTIEFELYYDLNNYVHDDIHGIKFSHHEYRKYSLTGTCNNTKMNVYNETKHDYLSTGNLIINDNTSLQAMLLPVSSEMMSSQTVKIQYRINFTIDAPEEGDWISFFLDASYISVIRPLRPVITLQETGSSINLYDNLVVLCNYYDIAGEYPIPITQLEIFKEGGYENVSIIPGFSLMNINFTQTGLQAYHFKVTFGDDYFMTEDKYVLVSKRNLACNVEFIDTPNSLKINVTITDAVNATPVPNTMMSFTVFQEGQLYSSIPDFTTNEFGWQSIEYNVTNHYFLWKYLVSVLIPNTTAYFGLYHESPVFTCTNCTPTVTRDGFFYPPGQNVLEDARVLFTIDSLRPLNRTWIMVDGGELCEITASIGTNDVYFLGIKGYHSYNVKTENILGETSECESYDMNLEEANATLLSSAGISGNLLIVSFQVENDAGYNIVVPVSIEIWDNGVLKTSVTLVSSATASTSYQYAFDVFVTHVFEVKITVDDVRYESNALSLTNSHVAVPIAAILIESIGSFGLLGVGSVYIIRKKRNGS